MPETQQTVAQASAGEVYGKLTIPAVGAQPVNLGATAATALAVAGSSIKGCKRIRIIAPAANAADIKYGGPGANNQNDWISAGTKDYIHVDDGSRLWFTGTQNDVLYFRAEF